MKYLVLEESTSADTLQSETLEVIWYNIHMLFLLFNFHPADTCNDLASTSSGTINYTPNRYISANLPAGRRYTGTIATYSCSPGYQLVGGSSLRACSPDGTWNGTQPSCGM